ncbi:hypothetical protein Tco_0538317 [Tanacetum coccineum]
MEIVRDDNTVIDVVPLASKPPTIVDYKIIKAGIIGHFQLIREDASLKRYSSMIKMLQGINREDLQILWKLVKIKHGDTGPEDEYERVLWGDLKVMFEPDIISDVWRSLQGYKVLIWKLFDSCGVHYVRFLTGISYEDIRPIFEKVWDQIHSFVPMDSKLEVRRLKRKGQEVQEESAKRQRTREVLESVQEQTDEEPKTEEGVNVEALQTKYTLIDWEIYTEDSRVYWKIIRVGSHTEIYQFFKDIVKNFDREDLVNLWKLVKDRFNSTESIDDKDKALWVELKSVFEPDIDDLLELQQHMHDPLTWRLYAASRVHHVSTETGLDMFMQVEKDYPLTRGLSMLMLVNKLQVDQHSEMAEVLLQKIFILANRPRK